MYFNKVISTDRTELYEPEDKHKLPPAKERNLTAKEGTSKAETDHAPKKDTEETLDGKDDSKNLRTYGLQMS
ncbi:Sodium channel protein type 10 subunit alpha [Trichinella spiralis]|uniref:Sodium channel protein type 10 subunit alpha n=1 Tax=Trichinella spiralis TaxID=6334 RepID=A0ABR3KDP3_TRISP